MAAQCTHFYSVNVFLTLPLWSAIFYFFHSSTKASPIAHDHSKTNLIIIFGLFCLQALMLNYHAVSFT